MGSSFGKLVSTLHACKNKKKTDSAPAKNVLTIKTYNLPSVSKTYLKRVFHFFCHQYFGCLPLKISSICLHSILKMISATRRIFFVFLLIFCHQYFGCLPLKISSVCLHSILKMISATRRIFFVFYWFFVISISIHVIHTCNTYI